MGEVSVVNVIRTRFQIWEEFLSLHDGLLLVLYHCCSWDGSVSPKCDVNWILDRRFVSQLHYLFSSSVVGSQRNVGDHSTCAGGHYLHRLWFSPWQCE